MEHSRPAPSSTPTKIFALIILLLLAALFIPLDGPHYTPASKRSRCANNLKVLNLALHEYHHDHGSFPPAFVVDDKGQPVHSWRGLVFPYVALHMGMEESADRYKLDEPWNGPHNSKLQADLARWCECPSYRSEHPDAPACCNYAAILDRTGVFRGTEPTKLSDTYTPSNTIMLVETHDNPPQWFEPRDITLDKLINQLQSHPIHGDETNSGKADMAIRRIDSAIDETTLRKLVDRESE